MADINTFAEILNSLKNEASPNGKFGWAFSQMIGGAEELNKTFGQGRQRITELMVAVSEATPAVDRLGGDLKDAVVTIRDVSKATSRNISASADEVSKLYSASKLLDTSVENIVGSFQDVGVQFSQIGGQLEQSLQYVQSIGGNAGQIMERVLNDMSALNKYNFENGVVGLTKMAAQASILKFDMRQTFDLADKAMSPDGAIELASAFQRLGVAAGDLTDPFELMYKSLNDPEGLQNSLVEMTKQYTYFDEKTKSFKINPAGILQLKELQAQTGLNAQEMSKLALNAADLDKKISQLKPSIKFESEEDKMYLANIAKMGVGGEYEVKISDTETKKLQDVTQEEFNKLIKQQKEGPKSLEDLQRSQLDAFTVVKGDLRSIRDKILFGVTSADTLRTEGEGFNRLLRIFSEKPEREFNEKYFREKAQGGIDTVKDIVSAISKGEDVGPAMQKAFDSAFKTMVEAQDKVDEGMQNVITNLVKDIKPYTTLERSAIDILKGLQKEEESKKSTERKKETPQNLGTSNLGESFKSGSASIANKVDVTNDLTKEGNIKLDHIAKNIVPTKENVSVSDNVANAFKVSSVGISDKVGITNDLTKISNDKLDAVEKALQEIRKDNTQMGGKKESVVKNTTDNSDRGSMAVTDNVMKSINKSKEELDGTKLDNNPILVKSELPQELTASISEASKAIKDLIQTIIETESSKGQKINTNNIEPNKELTAVADNITKALNEMRIGEQKTGINNDGLDNSVLAKNIKPIDSPDKITKITPRTEDVPSNTTNGFDNFNNSIASLTEKMSGTDVLIRDVVGRMDILSRRYSEMNKPEPANLSRNNISEAVSKIQPTTNVSEKTVNHKHDFDGTITWRIDAPPELDTKRFYAMIDKQEFRDAFTKIVVDKFKETENASMNNMG